MSDRVVWSGNRTALLLATNRRGVAVGIDIGDWSKFARPNGRLIYERGKPDAFANEMSAVFALNVDPGDTLHYGIRAGAAWFRYVPKYGTYSFNRFSAPTHLLVLVAAIPPVAWWAARKLRSSRRLRRQARGLCFNCGYDLRGSADRCPECGAACKAANPAGVSPAAGN